MRSGVRAPPRPPERDLERSRFWYERVCVLRVSSPQENPHQQGRPPNSSSEFRCALYEVKYFINNGKCQSCHCIGPPKVYCNSPSRLIIEQHRGKPHYAHRPHIRSRSEGKASRVHHDRSPSRLNQVKQGYTKTENKAVPGSLHSLIEQQPAFGCFDGN